MPLVKEHFTVMLWFRSGDLRGVRTLVDLSSAVDPTVHRSSLNLDNGAPLVKLHDAANKREKLFYALQGRDSIDILDLGDNWEQLQY